MMNREKKRVLLVASHGGHWVQLRRIAPAFDGLDICYASTNSDLLTEISPARLIVVPDANLTDKFAVMRLGLKMLWIVLEWRPDIVLSTGAAPGFFALMYGKLLGAKTIWVDSIANAEHMSVSGKKVRRFADLWLTQWPHLASSNGPFYYGGVV